MASLCMSIPKIKRASINGNWQLEWAAALQLQGHFRRENRSCVTAYIPRPAPEFGREHLPGNPLRRTKTSACDAQPPWE